MGGQTLSHYQVLERLGGGGMGVVYKALDTTLDRHVALKFLPSELTRDDEARRRFMQEAKAASALDHPNVCTIYEIASTPDDQLFIAMGYYAGETLKQRIGRGPVAIDDALDIIRQVGEGLAEAHAAGIVHRDIKPANIVITTSGLVKVLDFGIAKLTGVTGLTDTGITLGTVSYMSPEQVNGEDAGPQSDVWALGVVLYELLTGQTPFPGDRPAVVMHAITGRAPTPVRDLCPVASAAVVRVVTGALEKSRERRYQTARAFLAAMPAAGTAASVDGDALSSTAETRPTHATVGAGTGASEVPSIAVLPFVNMSPDPEQDYFCDGLAEELIDALARLDGLRVVARTSAFRFRGDAPDLREVGRKLNVKTVLEGSVRKAGHRLRINTQLINAEDGYHLWSERYDRELDDVFAVQDEIARAVVDKLRGELLGEPVRLLIKRSTKSLDAYQAYMQARHYRFSRYNTPKAMQCYEEALRHDPGYAAAWAGLADAAVSAGIQSLCAPTETSARARTAVERALALDDGLSEVHHALGKIRYWFDWQWSDAERAFTRALELNRGNVDAHTHYATCLALLCRTDEALSQVARARELDPLSAYALSTAGVALLMARRYDEAVAMGLQALELQPGYRHALRFLTQSYQASGRYEEAVSCLDAFSEETALLGHRGAALARAGRSDEARRILTELTARSQHEHVSPYSFARIHVALGEVTAGIDYLEKAFDERSPELPLVQLPFWDPVRDDPRGQDFLRRLNLPDPRSNVS